MDAVENAVLEPRAERIARYKAERRRELAERYGNTEELPSKWVRRDGEEGGEPAATSRGRPANADGFCPGVNGKTAEVPNGLDVEAEPGSQRRQVLQDSGSTLSPPGEGTLDAPQLHTRVSVGQLRTALLQQAEPENIGPDGGRAASSLDLAVQPDSDPGRRRTRRYLQGGSGGGRKTSDRFRTQPITAGEMEASSGTLDAEEPENGKADVKTDERAKMSVAAKMSLFKELEKGAAPEASAFLKPRSASVCHERRTRRGNDPRFLTQPITCEEMVAISAPKAPPPEAPPPEAESVEDGDESCKLSLSEKLALFNKLSLPGAPGGPGAPERPPERRRQKGARYRTQPITVEEVSLLQKVPVQLPVFSLAPQLSDRQQSSALNLKPSEVRLSQPPSDSGPDPGPGPEPVPVPQRRGSEPGLKGILKKSRPAGSELSGQNGAELSAPPRRPRREDPGPDGGSQGGAPWRQRTRNRREPRAAGTQDQRDSREEPASWAGRVHGGEEEEERRTEEEFSSSSRTAELQQTEQPERLPEAAAPQSWDPVFSSVFSASEPQYIMCFNQTSMSFEAQEVSSPSRILVQPQWRQKGKGGDMEEMTSQQEVTGREVTGPEVLAVQTGVSESEAERSSNGGGKTHDDWRHSVEAEPDAPHGEETPASDGGSDLEPPPPAACVRPPGGGGPAPDGEQDLDVFCQTNTTILTSAVAEHRRSVRPSRRTQGSRNPLRALAARDDVRQDLMGDRMDAASEEPNQNHCKNPSPSDGDGPTARPPFSSLMLIHVKGRRRLQVRLAKPTTRSLNSGDCFLLVSPRRCFVWVGRSANEAERAKARDLAAAIQARGDLGCRAAEVVLLEEGLNADGPSADDFWSLLGGRGPYGAAGAPDEDERFERGVVESNCVYRLLEDRLVPQEQAWAATPSVALLQPSEALVFDFGSELYLWSGRDVSPRRRGVALQLSGQVWGGAYDYKNCSVNPLDPSRCNPDLQPAGEGRPGWALLGVLAQDQETVLFQEKFLDWTEANGRDHLQPDSPTSDLLSPCDARALLSARPDAPDARRSGGGVLLEAGGGAELETTAVEVWHVQEFEDSETPLEDSSQLHEGDSYVVRWTRRSGSAEDAALFLWRGRHSSTSGRDSAAFLSIGTKNPEESQVVPQGEEPPCFLQLFQGGLVVHRGKRDAAPPPAGWRLFLVRGEVPDEALLLEVEPSCSGLRSRGAAVLLNGQQEALFLWSGCKAHSSVKEAGRRAVERIVLRRPPELGLRPGGSLAVQPVEEGSEPAEFWAALGPVDRKAYDCMLHDPGKYNFTPRLFHLSAASGSFRAEELQSPWRLPGLVTAMPFVQERLLAAATPALFLLDNRLEVYLWQRGQPGPPESPSPAWCRWHQERRCAMQTALQYCTELNPRRPPLAYLVLEGSEPLTFTNVFPRWERSSETHTQGDGGRQKLTLVQDALAQLMRTQFPLEELPRSPLPAGVDPQRQEVYLSDQGFQTLLEAKRDEVAVATGGTAADLKTGNGPSC